MFLLRLLKVELMKPPLDVVSMHVIAQRIEEEIAKTCYKIVSFYSIVSYLFSFINRVKVNACKVKVSACKWGKLNSE